MKTLEFNTRLVNSYFEMLKSLSFKNKKTLISKLSKSIESDKEPNGDFESSFGAWESDESAEDIIDTLRTSRNFTRNTEPL